VGANLRFHAGSVDAWRYYIEKRGWDTVAFNNTDWPSLNETLAIKRKMFHAWLCMQAANCSATGTNMCRWFCLEYTACPNCNQANKHAGHLLRCPDKGRTNYYMSSVADLERWFAKGHTDPDLAHYTIEYLRGRGEETFSSFDLPVNLRLLAGHQDDITC
jgi:hypothetical protein